MIQSITQSITEYFYPTNYWRDVTENDKKDFEKRILKGEGGRKDSTYFYNKKTNEITFESINKVIYHRHRRFTFEKFYKTVFKGTAIGVIASGAPTLAGYCIIQVKYGALIGSAIGAIKVYVVSNNVKTQKIHCLKDPKLLAELGLLQENT